MSGFGAPQPPMQGDPMPGAPPGGPPPGMQPNPAFAQWAQQAQKVQAIQEENAKRQAAFDAAVALIRKDGIHGFRLDIEADSTIAPDEQAEKQARVEFLQQMVPLLQQVVPIAQGNPPLASLSKEIALFAARGFRVARPMEEALEQAFDAIAKMPPNPKASGQDTKGASGPNPQIEAAKLQASTQVEAAKAQAAQHDTDTQAQTDRMTADAKAQTDRMAIAQKNQQAQQDAALAMQKMQFEASKAQQDAAFEAADLQLRQRQQQAHEMHLASQNARELD